MYNVMGSGPSNGIYALLIADYTYMTANGGKDMGLLCGASSRFAAWFYALHRALCLKMMVLFTTIHNPKFAELDLVKKNTRVRCAIMYIKSKTSGSPLTTCSIPSSLPSVPSPQWTSSAN